MPTPPGLWIRAGMIPIFTWPVYFELPELRGGSEEVGGVRVIDVIDEDDRVAHVLAAPLPPTPAPIDGVVDWKRRFDHMQQHTGQHLLSAVFEDLFGHKTLSVHFGADYSTLDLDTEILSRDRMIAAEERANAVVAEARPVTVAFEDATTVSGLRKPSDRAGTLRVVTIDALDRSACGGTHVRNTAEIGAVLLRSAEKVRSATRVEFVCGVRAVRRARRDFESLTRIATSLSAALDDVASLVSAHALAPSVIRMQSGKARISARLKPVAIMRWICLICVTAARGNAR